MVTSGAARSEPAHTGDERAMLDGWLDYYRATLVHKCAGLSGDQLVERSCPPSSMSLAGLVRHMTEMERVHIHRLENPQLPSPDGKYRALTRLDERLAEARLPSDCRRNRPTDDLRHPESCW